MVADRTRSSIWAAKWPVFIPVLLVIVVAAIEFVAFLRDSGPLGEPHYAGITPVRDGRADPPPELPGIASVTCLDDDVAAIWLVWPRTPATPAAGSQSPGIAEGDAVLRIDGSGFSAALTDQAGRPYDIGATYTGRVWVIFVKNGYVEVPRALNLRVLRYDGVSGKLLDDQTLHPSPAGLPSPLPTLVVADRADPHITAQETGGPGAAQQHAIFVRVDALRPSTKYMRAWLIRSSFFPGGPRPVCLFPIGRGRFGGDVGASRIGQIRAAEIAIEESDGKGWFAKRHVIVPVVPDDGHQERFTSSDFNTAYKFDWPEDRRPPKPGERKR
ncbi:MAG TPA: hypothetical protein VMI31_19210 [Fimbriimonadaceae bacterium]|nr:hypothetical protein [Fimbriimonadaceae bacterium]